MTISYPEMIDWGKYLKFSSSTNIFISGVIFSTDGSLIISHSAGITSEIILIFNATDGNLLTSRSYTPGNYFNYDF